MKKILLTLLFLALLQSAAFTQWYVQAYNPAYLDCHFLFNSTTGWACGTDGVIRKTINSGTNWENQYTNTKVTLNAIHFVNDQTGWAAGEDGVILRSTNSGTNWVQQTTGVTNRILDISFLNATTGIAGASSGKVLRTTNAGTNWNVVTIPGSVQNVICVLMKYEAFSYATVSDSKFCKSTDAGASWSVISTTPATISDIHFAADELAFASTFSSTVLKTTNAGVNWVQYSPGTSYPLENVLFTNTQTGFVTDLEGKIFRTTNAGVNWVVSSTVEGSITEMAVLPGTVLFICGQSGLTATGDSFGNNFTNTSQGGRTMISDIYFMNNQTGWAANEWDQLLYTTNAGANWSFTSSIGLEDIQAVHFINANTGYALGLTNDDMGGSAPTINKTTNAGASWQTIGFTGSNPMSLQFVNNNDGFMLAKNGANSVVHRTTNAGVNWFTYTTNIEIYDCYFTTQSNGWVCGKNGVIMRSTDGGATWGLQSTGVTDSLLSVYFRNASFGWACGTNGRIIATTNGGVNWSSQTSGTNKTLTGIEFGSTTLGAACGLGGTRLNTLNGGTSWVNTPEPSQTDIYAVCITPGNNTFIGGEYGYISAISDFTAISPVNNIVPSEFTLSQNYPNPFNPATTIDFSLSVGGLTSLEIFDITGKVVSTIVRAELKAGSYSVNFDAGSLASGVYFYKLSSVNVTQVKKMLLVK